MLASDLPVSSLALAHGVAASAITVHVLLNKRNVRAATGWIGLAWLSPFVGCFLYWLLGINRVKRRAGRLNRRGHPLESQNGAQLTDQAPEQFSALAAVGRRATGRPLSAGNAISLLRGGDEAYPSMLTAIGEARRSIALASYIFRDDSIGQKFMDALAAAHARGVEVRVLLDGVGGGYLWSGAERRLRRNDVPVARFLHDWLPWRMPMLNMRNHKKLLIVDGAVGFTGGLNIGAENVASSERKGMIRDTHFRIDGPGVAQLMGAFAADWEFAAREALAGERWRSPIRTAGSALARGVSQGPDEDEKKLEAILLAAVAEARTRVRVITPYFLPDERLFSVLELAAMRGVKVEIAVPERTNKRYVDWAMRAHVAELIAAGCHIYWTPTPFDHSKLMTVDGLWSLIGSANWDERSFRLNFEFNVEIYDHRTATDIDSLIDEKLTRARVVTREQIAKRGLLVKLRDAAARLALPYL